MSKEYYEGNINSTKIYEVADKVLTEVSEGIFYVEKDRRGEYPPYIGIKKVIKELNSSNKVVVKRKGGGEYTGESFANFDAFILNRYHSVCARYY